VYAQGGRSRGRITSTGYSSDNVDLDPEEDRETGGYDVRRYIPGDHGSVLITTRLSRLAQLGDSKQLQKVDKELGKAIFERWYGRELGM
jgi:hypothetical protein